MSSKPEITEAAGLLACPGAPVHLIGVSGSGMIGIAKMLLEKGCRVTGSDLNRDSRIATLEQCGLKFYSSHDAENVGDIAAVVYSSAISPDNVERKSAKQRGIPQYRRAEMLAAICRGRELNVVGGTHGKTTTSLLLTEIYREAGRDPGYYIGADIPAFDFSAGLGSGGEMVIEADESDGTLGCYDPARVLILNVEADHLDHYGSLGRIEEAFLGLVKAAKNAVVLCVDDPVCRKLAGVMNGCVTYSAHRTADYQALDIRLEAGSSVFEVNEGGKSLGVLRLNLPGLHNVSNALGALAVARTAGVDFRACKEALGRVRGAGRRFDIRYRDENHMIVDDYAHHPTEIRATLSAAKCYGAKRILAAFQPHRYSRSHHLQGEFAGAFGDAARVFLTDIYSAGESPIAGVSGAGLAAAVKATEGDGVEYADTLKDLKTALSLHLQPGDCVITMGAGNIHQVAGELAKDLALYKKIAEKVGKDEGSVLKLYEPMSRHTTLRVGGPAQLWFEPSGEEVLGMVRALCQREGVPVTVIGRGSNLLVLDHGISGLCVHLGQPEFSGIRIENGRIYAGAGARLKQIVFEAKKASLGGFEFMEGIPGNLGGALRMNAGAMNSWTMEWVESVRYMSPEGRIGELPRDEIKVQYRSVPFFDENIALGAWLRADSRTSDESGRIMREYSEKRWNSQPAAPSAGCTFKNAKEIPAGKLIDELGLKDAACGGARISSVHANFIVNDGKATGSDVLELIKMVKRKAKEQRGIDLELEVIVLGD